MAVIVASRVATIFFLSVFVLVGRKILSIFEEEEKEKKNLKKKKIDLKKKSFCKNEKKVSSRTFFRHPAGPPETEFFF